MEEHASIQVSLAVENMHADASDKTKRLIICCSRTSNDPDCEIPSKFNISDGCGEGEPCSQSDKQKDVNSGAGIVREVYLVASNDCQKEELALRVSEANQHYSCKVRNASLQNSLLEVTKHQAETNLCSQISDTDGPTQISNGIRSLSFHVQGDGTKKYVNLKCSSYSHSLHAPHDGISHSELHVTCSPSLKNEVSVEKTTINPGSDTISRIVDREGIQLDFNQHCGLKDCHSMSLTPLDETNECNVFSTCQKSHLEHCGLSEKASLLDCVPGSSSQHAFGTDEMNTIESCVGKGIGHEVQNKPSLIYRSPLSVLEGLHSVPINSVVKKAAAVASPLTVIEIAPSVHSPNDFTLCSSSHSLDGCARHIREQGIHASVTQVTLAERKHISGMSTTSALQGRLEVKKDKVAKRGRRSSKAVKFDECMKSFSVVSRKKRSYLSKPARSYVWWSSGTVLQSLKIDMIAGASESKSWREGGSSKSKKVCKKSEPGSTVFGDKTGTPSTCISLKGKSMKAVNQTGLTAAVPYIHDCPPPQITDCAFEIVKECSGRLNGECNMKYNGRNRGIRLLQAHYGIVNSRQADTFPDTLKLDNDLDHITKNLDGITHDITRSARVYIATFSQDDVKAMEENVENSFLDPENSPDSEVIDTIPEGGATSIDFTYASRKKGKKKEMPIIGGDSSGTSQSLNSSCFVPDPNFDKTPNTSNSVELTKGMSEVVDSRSKEIDTLKHDPVQKNLASEIIETCSDQICQLGNHFAPGDTSISAECVSKDWSILDISDSDVPKAWASCDNCGKWRRIPSSLADYIKKMDCRWTCNDNMDKAFSDCSIPQEKSDQAINQELGLSDCDEDVPEVSDAGGLKRRQSKASERERWTPIKTNSYLHRKRRNQTIDEIMVCNCKPPRDGGLGCGEECLNRMLNIECVQGTCPCGDLCSNQQFQERNYAKLKSFKSGKKGYGLRSEEYIRRGQFLIEYVGEVLDMHAYEARQKDYAAKGHKHFYFMTLNGSEVIDACSKGNLGRYINHSCESNCRTEKWMVNGEICIGLFAVRNIKKGEEVTFDYNYVRVSGAAAKKCKCGSSRCRGFIGGNPLNSEVVAHDSDEEDPEYFETDRELNTSDRSDMISTTKNTNIDENQDAVISTVIESLHLDAHGETESSADVSTSSISQSENLENLNETMHLSCPPCIPHFEVGLGRMQYECIDASLKTCPDYVEVDQEPPRSSSTKKSIISSSSLKKTNNKALNLTQKKSVLITNNPKNASNVSGRHEGVQEKLNQLLDTGGGISKRKEAPKAYLKLLILTTASDNSGNGEAIQSNRDLSMILDALLKTKSRVVLADIINKNGLRMLHNLMKQYRRDFNRTPIIRKLLKILEYLAENRILNLEHINGGPPCPGMESFAESVLALTEHRNRQVHQIARSFRDRWISRPIRKFSCKEDGKITFPRGSSIEKFLASRSNHNGSPEDTKGQIYKVVSSSTQADGGRYECFSASSLSSFLASGSMGRKRKSKWDQNEWIRRDGSSVRLKESKAQYSTPESLQQTNADKVASSSISELNLRHSIAYAEVLNMNEDVPPGFSAPRQDRAISSASPTNDELGSQNVKWTPDPSEVVQGHPLRKFISRSPISYAIPISFVDQDVASKNGTVGNLEISPSLLFHPFPPLP
ncbi:unnamed protein product [Rhodiola kirilowii]